MRKPLAITILLGIVLALAALGGYSSATPRLLSVAPQAGAENVSPASEVRLTFTRRLQSEGVASRLSFVPAMPGQSAWEGSTLVFTPSQPWPAGAAVQARLLPGAPASGFLPLQLPQGLDWSFTIRQSSIIYLYPANAPANLTIQNPISGVTRSLVNRTGGVLDFDLSADGAWLYYSLREDNGSAIYRLSLLETLSSPATPGGDAAAAETQLVLTCPAALCAALALSPQGEYLAYERGMLPGSGQAENFQVWLLPLQAGQPAEPFLAGATNRQTTQPVWSPNGWLAFYDSTEAAYIFYQPGAGERGRFPNQTGQGGVWRPDGLAFLAAEIVFVNPGNESTAAGLQPRADSHLRLYHLDTGETQDLTPGEGIEDASPLFSPDGQFLVFARKYLDARRWTPGRQLWIARAATREARALTDAPLYNYYQFSWNLSGDRLAYVRFNQSAPSEPPEIWLMDLLAGTESRLVVGGYAPRWTP